MMEFAVSKNLDLLVVSLASLGVTVLLFLGYEAGRSAGAVAYFAGVPL